VHAILIIETVQTLFTVADCGYWFITGFGNFERLQRSFLSPLDRAILNSFVAIAVRSFFCYRIWNIKKSMFWWCCAIQALSLVQFIGNVGDGISGLKHGNIRGPHLQVCFIYLGLTCSAVADVAVTATLTQLLARALIRESKSSIEHVLRRILRFVVETNFISACMSALSFVMFAAAPNHVYWYFPAVIVGKIYSNTLLASLNNRIPLEEHRRNASTHISSSRASTPVEAEENSTRTWRFPDYFVGRTPTAVSSDIKSAPPFIVSFDQQINEEEFAPSSKQLRPFSMQCIHKPQYPESLATPLRHRIGVPLSASFGAKNRSSRISLAVPPVRPLPPTPTPL
jgi:hypothetical protein